MLIIALIGFKVLTASHAVTVTNPYNIQLGVMDAAGWNGYGTGTPEAYIKTLFSNNRSTPWDRLWGTNSTAVTAALSNGYNVVIETPANPTTALAEAKQYMSWGKRVVFEYGNEPWIASSYIPVATYAQSYQAAYNLFHANNIPQPLLFMTVGDPNGTQGGLTWLDEALKAVPNLQVDAFSAHPYGEANQDTGGHSYGVNAFIADHTDAVNHGFTNTPWYITEFGFTVCRPTSSGCTATSSTSSGWYVPSYAQQAVQTTNAYKQLMTLPYLKLIMWYQAHDDGTGCFGLFSYTVSGTHDYAGEGCAQTAGSQAVPVYPRPALNALVPFMPHDAFFQGCRTVGTSTICT
jgi:hypothetical protein